MEKYDYLEHEISDVLDYIKENGIEVTEDNRDEIEEKLNDDLWDYDGVTGNGSGSYTFSSWDAEENLCHNLDLLKEACDRFGSTPDSSSAEVCDVIIRCYLLGQAISKALDRILNK